VYEVAYISHPFDDQLSLFCEQPKPASYRDPPYLQSVSVYKVTLVRESSIPIHDQRLNNSADCERLIRTYLQGVDREHFIVLLVNRKNEVIGVNTVSMGSLTGSVVSPREVFKPAILANAAAIICAHNHPSGDPKPSPEDRALTARLHDAGKLLDIQVLDHIIIGDGTTAYYSFADNGRLAG
jgi:DNA repair protein RadC